MNTEELVGQINNYFADNEFSAKIILRNDDFCIIDWSSPHTGDMAMRFILDKKKGDFIITGDSGNCIASWYSETDENYFYVFCRDIKYFIEKIKACDHKYTYDIEDALEDLKNIKEEYLNIDEQDEEFIPHEEVESNFLELESMFKDYNDVQSAVQKLYHSRYYCALVEKYNPGWIYDERWTDIGRRINPRLYWWTIGFRTAFEQLKKNE